MQFMCDTLTNSCGADATAKAMCKTAPAAADAASKGTGAQADAFNAAFGITTDCAALAVISNTGTTISPGANPVGRFIGRVHPLPVVQERSPPGIYAQGG
ncbi:unnamed protein product [Peniophora sp. CBMAI 1063]|nr:unnamed protein product [Peniophora sp. CBMAI 1063]